MAELTGDIRETVRTRYASAARAAAQGDYMAARTAEYEIGGANPGNATFTQAEASAAADAAGLYGAALYDEATGGEAPRAALEAPWVAVCRQPSPTSRMAMSSLIWGPAPAQTCSSAPVVSRPAAGRSGST